METNSFLLVLRAASHQLSQGRSVAGFLGFSPGANLLLTKDTLKESPGLLPPLSCTDEWPHPKWWMVGGGIGTAGLG